MGQPDQSSGISQFVTEMKRRHVVRFALGYAAVAFVVLQLAEIVFPAFGIGEAGLRVLVVLTALGFLPSIVLAWVYDITTEGIKRTDDDEAPAGVPSRLALVAALLVTTVGVTGGLGLYLANQGAFAAIGDDGTDFGQARTVTYDPSVPIRSLAVLPLDDFSPNMDQAYFTAGMHDELIAKLSLLDDVRVVSRTTVMQYEGTTLTTPEIGRELGVDVLVEGSVSRGGDRVRVTLQIIHAPSDSHIETLQWDRDKVEDLLAFQTEIARAVVHEIDSHEENTFDRVASASNDPAAQEAYFKAKLEYERGTADGYEMALDYFEEALAADPDFAPAMAGLAGARFLVGLGDPEIAEEELALAHEEAHAALQLDSTSTEVKEVLSFIERSMPRVMAKIVAPEEPLAASGVHVMTMPGTFDSIVVDFGAFDTTWVSAMTSLGEGIEQRVRSRWMGPEREGEAGNRQAQAARQMMSSGRYTEAARLLESIVEEAPQTAPAWEMLARSHIASGDAPAAADVIEQWHDTGSPNAPDEGWVLRLQDTVEFEGARGYWAWRLDRLTALAAADEPVPRVELAAAHAALGNDDEAFLFLMEALVRGEPGVLTLRVDPVWDDLRRDPRFGEVARQAQWMRFSPTRRPGRRGGPGDGR